mmetsp:Transcript_44846/g.108827  ORF Transcript_44846/g.108827 Transcript_44846/m.108827 type:complete len:220 (+) Transcript_44846:3272-3931(+)
MILVTPLLHSFSCTLHSSSTTTASSSSGLSSGQTSMLSSCQVAKNSLVPWKAGFFPIPIVFFLNAPMMKYFTLPNGAVSCLGSGTLLGSDASLTLIFKGRCYCSSRPSCTTCLIATTSSNGRTVVRCDNTISIERPGNVLGKQIHLKSSSWYHNTLCSYEHFFPTLTYPNLSSDGSLRSSHLGSIELKMVQWNGTEPRKALMMEPQRMMVQTKGLLRLS